MLNFENGNSFELYNGDCLEIMRSMPDNSIDSIVTDPPYGLSFMGKKWDYDVPGTEVWAECLRVLKPGGHLLAFAGTRTQHRMAVRIEDAGFEIRDMIAWVYGSGFPKSMNVSIAIDKAAGVITARGKGFNAAGVGESNGGSSLRSDHPDYVPPIGITEDARKWQGWGTALKPALEPITVARKPLAGTVAGNVLEYGTGALNIDGCRVPSNGESTVRHTLKVMSSKGAKGGAFGNQEHNYAVRDDAFVAGSDIGRWPANLIHDGSDDVLAGFPDGAKPARTGRRGGSNAMHMSREVGENEFQGVDGCWPADSGGSAARFFYCSKASKRDRNEGCEDLPAVRTRLGDGCQPLNSNTHPTVKPTDLMAYLCRLVTPPGGVVLDPFMGSGSTGKAAMREGFRFIGIERDESYMAIADARIRGVSPGYNETPKNENVNGETDLSDLFV